MNEKEFFEWNYDNRRAIWLNSAKILLIVVVLTCVFVFGVKSQYLNEELSLVSTCLAVVVVCVVLWCAIVPWLAGACYAYVDEQVIHAKNPHPMFGSTFRINSADARALIINEWSDPNGGRTEEYFLENFDGKRLGLNPRLPLPQFAEQIRRHNKKFECHYISDGMQVDQLLKNFHPHLHRSFVEEAERSP